MNRLFPLPFYTFLKIAAKNGGVSPRKLKNITPWLIKTILFEPLRWAELAKYNQKVREHRIEKHPLFILGYYRSGTSYLHQCLIQDDRFSYHSNFQMVLPEVMLTCEKTLLPVFELVSRTFNLPDSVHRVPLSFRFPGEEDATMTTYVDPRGAQWGYFFPPMMEEQFQKYVLFENLSADEKEAWKQSFEFLLKKISFSGQGRQLVLKSPPNTARIQLLLSLFPDAKFLFIHRNPYQVFASNQQFWKVVQRIYAMKGTRSSEVNTMILDTYSRIMDRYLQEKDLVPSGQLMELGYEEFIRAPLPSLRKAYATLQLGDFDYCEDKMSAFTGSQKTFARLKHELPDEEKKMVAEKLEPFFKHWDYPI